MDRLTNVRFGTNRLVVVMEAFLSIKSPVFSELVVVLAGHEVARLPQEAMMFETLRQMNEARPFKLVFSFEDSCFIQVGCGWESAEPRRELERALASVTAEGFLDFLDSPPAIR